MINALTGILERPRTVLTLMLVMIVAGVVAYINVPKEAQPNIDVPIYVVTVSQQGISPGDAERLLVRPLESELRGLDGLKELTMTAYQGAAVALLEFQIETDKDEVLADLRDKVDQAKANFPADANEPIVQETNTALQPTLIVTLSGTTPERTLYRFARQLKDEIESIATVREAKIVGDREEVLEVILDLALLESYDITQTELLNALSQNNQLVAAGALDEGTGRFNIKVPGLVETAADVFSIPIKQQEEAVVTLGDVAQIKRTFKDPTEFTRVNGEPAVSLEITKRLGTNIIENNQAVRDRVAQVSKDWPSTVKINFLLDESNFIGEVQQSLQSSILTAIALVMIVVVFSLGLRSGLLVGLSVPLSFMVGFLILSSVGMTVNMMVLFGLVLTVGMLVDGAIVVTEYADRKLSEGLPPKEAYVRAAQLMFWPVVSSTLTTLAAFLPLLLWPGVAGEFMSYLPTMVIIVLSASLLTALIFLPASGYNFPIVIAVVGGVVGAALMWALGDGLLEGLPIPEEMAQAVPALLAVGGFVLGAVLSFSAAKWDEIRRRRSAAKNAAKFKMMAGDAPLDIKALSPFMRTYLRIVKFFSGNLIGNALAIFLVLAGAGALGPLGIPGIFQYFAANAQGVQFFVSEEADQASVLVSARGNLSPEQVRDIVDEVGGVVMNVAGVENVVMTAKTPGTGGGGNPFGNGGDRPADVIGEIQMELSNYFERRDDDVIFDEIRARTANVAGVKLEIAKKEGGPPTGKDVQIEVNGSDYDDVLATAQRVRDKFEATSGLIDLEDTTPLPGIEWELKVNREEAGRFNAGIQQIGAMIQLVTDGVLIGKYRPSDARDEVDIRVRLPENQRNFATLDDLKLRTQNGQVPLSNFIERSAQPKVASIKRRDGLYSMRVKANVDAALTVTTPEGGTRPLTADDKVRELQAWIDGETFPSSVQLGFRGADEEQAKSQAFLQQAGAIALFLMFIILVTQFNSFYQTILTLGTVVLAVFGVLLGLALLGQKFSIIMTGTGIVALAGIVVNNAIVLIDTFNRLRAEGVETREAVLKTSAQRLRPILLTTITTILGLVPMAMQVNFDFINQRVVEGGITSTWWVQLSTAIISGLAVSTVLTLVMIPTMLALPANLAALGRTATGRSYREWRDRRAERKVAVAGAGLGTLYGAAREARVAGAVGGLGGLLDAAHEARAEPAPSPIVEPPSPVALGETLAEDGFDGEDRIGPVYPFREAAE